MLDYAELIKAWRYCAESKTCDGCPMQKNCPDINHQIVAADAIEELLAEKAKIENSGKLIAAAFERLKEKVPHWISVEELLAERTAFWVDTQPHLDDISYKKDGMSYYCSNCHHRAGKYKHRSYKFCPWCGARIVPKDTAIADMLPPLQNGEDKADLIEQMERFQEYAKGGSK